MASVPFKLVVVEKAVAALSVATFQFARAALGIVFERVRWICSKTGDDRVYSDHV